MSSALLYELGLYDLLYYKESGGPFPPLNNLFPRIDMTLSFLFEYYLLRMNLLFLVLKVQNLCV